MKLERPLNDFLLDSHVFWSGRSVVPAAPGFPLQQTDPVVSLKSSLRVSFCMTHEQAIGKTRAAGVCLPISH